MANDCKPCTEGTYQSDTGSTYCLPCYPGKFNSQAGERACLPCPIGQYTNAIKQTQCKSCPKGKHGKESTQTLCFDCLPGQYSSTEKASACNGCSAGRYQTNPGQTYCNISQSDQVVGRGGSSVIAIAKGWYATNVPHNSTLDPSLPCPPGTKGEVPPSRQCIPCPAGWTSYKGNIDCVKCEPGKFSKHNAAPNCTKCDTLVRAYSDEYAATQCETCDVAQRSTGESCEALGVDPALEVPKIIGLVINGTNRKQMHLLWTYGGEKAGKRMLTVKSFKVEVSPVRTFKSAQIFELKVNSNAGKDPMNEGKNYSYRVVLNQPAYEQTMYARVSASVVDDESKTILLSNVPTPLGGWLTWNCPQQDTSYLDTTSMNPLDWQCHSCPENAYCGGLTTYDQVKARFGYWRYRNTSSSLVTSDQFVMCAFPAVSSFRL
jgi:hypothetical protein